MPDKQSRFALRWIGRAGLLACLTAGVSCFELVGQFGQPMPTELKQPAVLAGKDVLTVRDFLKEPSLGTVTDIVLDDGEHPRVGITGLRGAVWCDLQGNKKSSVSFASPATHVDFVDVDGNGTFEFIDRGGVGWQDSALMDDTGRTLWEYGSRSGRSSNAVDDMAAGDFDGDGVSEFVVGHNGGGGVHLLDKDGKRQWRQSDSNVWHVEVVDTDADGTPEIVHSNAGGQITVRDAKGKVLDTSRPPAYFSAFSLCHYPQQNSPTRLLFSEKDTIWLVDFDGKQVAQLKAPHCGELGHARGKLVNFEKDKPPYLAVVVEFTNWDRAVLYVYNDAQSLVYQEVIGEICSSLSTIANSDTGGEILLVGIRPANDTPRREVIPRAMFSARR